jgi:hypothetical protein
VFNVVFLERAIQNEGFIKIMKCCKRKIYIYHSAFLIVLRSCSAFCLTLVLLEIKSVFFFTIYSSAF